MAFNDEQRQHLDQLMNAIQQRWGEQALRRLERATAHQTCIPTGYAAVDALLGGDGLPRGMLTVLSGYPTSGITTLALDILAQAQKNGEVTIYIDPARTLDAEYVAKRGIDLSRLLMICPHSHEVGFDMARDIMLSGGAGVIIYDLGYTASIPPTSGSPLRRLTAGLSRTPYTLICLSSAGDGFHSVVAARAGIHLHLERLRWLQRLDRVAGYEVRVTVLKNKRTPRGQTASLSIWLDKRRRSL